MIIIELDSNINTTWRYTAIPLDCFTILLEMQWDVNNSTMQTSSSAKADRRHCSFQVINLRYRGHSSQIFCTPLNRSENFIQLSCSKFSHKETCSRRFWHEVQFYLQNHTFAFVSQLLRSVLHLKCFGKRVVDILLHIIVMKLDRLTFHVVSEH